jgi:S-adenosylmethionine synthetase
LHYDNQTFASLDDDPCVVVTVRVPDGSGGMKDVVTRIDKKTGQVVGNPAGS